MLQRVTSSVAVVVVGVLPMILGGPVFALLMVIIGVLGYLEFRALVARLLPDWVASLESSVSSRSVPVWSTTSAPDFKAVTISTATSVLAVIGFGAAALAGWNASALVALVTFAVLGPMVAALMHASRPGAVFVWSAGVAGSLYLAIPVFAAVALRGLSGTVEQSWLTNLSDVAAIGWPSAPRGLAWVSLVVFTIWIGDSAAYLFGRPFGGRKLAPIISPNKTVEGAVAGLVASTVTAMLSAALFGLGLTMFGAALLGAGIAVVGQLGDLGESLVKRQAGVKDSGALIPGHGGILDRVDALLFAFPAAWIAITLIDGTLT